MKKKVFLVLLVLLILSTILLLINDLKPNYQVGDINKDNKISLIDLLKLNKFLLGYHDIPIDEMYIADVNEDGFVNDLDLNALQNILLKIDDID